MTAASLSGISDSIFDALFSDLVHRIRPATVLDIGPGRGKYARILRQACPEARLTAVEVSPEYVQAFGLAGMYDEVVVQDAALLVEDRSFRDRTFDLVVIGDCIEHLPKSRAIDLLNFLTYRCGYLVVVAPEFVFYDTADMQHTESHISVWSEEDFRWHDRWAFMRSEYMQFFLLRGYKKAAIGFEELVRDSNAAPSPVHHQNGTVLKTSELVPVVRHHTEAVNGNLFFYRNP
jgi:hypothetical protein